MAMMFSIARDGNSFGNFTEEVVREGLRSGRFLLTDLGWREGMATWQPLSQFPEFAQASAPGATTTPTPDVPPAPAPAVATTATVAPGSPTVIATTRTEPLAIWSLVLSLAGLFCCGFLLGIPGIICGHMALGKIKKEPTLQGHGLAVAGLVIGYVAVGLWLLWMLFFGGTAFLQALSQGTSH